jgi:hypothetical protein
MHQIRRVKKGVSQAIRGPARRRDAQDVAESIQDAERTSLVLRTLSIRGAKDARKISAKVAVKPTLTGRQPGSANFFTVMPAEIRLQIYSEVIQNLGDSVHIYKQGGRYTTSECVVTNHDGSDERQDALEALRSQQPTAAKFYDSSFWRRRLASSWSNHYLCEENVLGELKNAGSSCSKAADSGLLALMLTCKQA